MLCENCGKNQANVKYTQIINGDKKELFLCDECSSKMGVGNFNMPINFSSFFGDFLMDFEKDAFLPTFNLVKDLKCNNCDLSFEEFVQNGKFGCSDCYNAFQGKIDPILKNIQGSNRHIGRLGKISENIDLKKESPNISVKESNAESKIEKLKKDLKLAIKEERYEDAAKLRDEIVKEENNN